MRGKLVAAVVVTALWGSSMVPAASALTAPGTTCRVLPVDNVWHLDVRALPVHPKNDQWKRATHARGTLLHPDFGPPDYGIPFDTVGSAFPTVRVRFRYADESDRGPYPFGPSTAIEGGSDRHALVIDRSDCRLYELYDARWNGGRPRAGSGAIFPLEGPRANVLRPAGWTSADAAGLPIFPGLLRHDEVTAGEVDQAIRLTVGCTTDRYVWPARHEAGVSDRRCPPMGARFRLKRGFPLRGFGPAAQTVLRAMKRYGLIVSDNGSDWYFQGTVDDRWTNTLLDQLKTVPAKAFQAVDASGCRVSKDSAEFAYGLGCPAP
jgi:hypothetical protein